MHQTKEAHDQTCYPLLSELETAGARDILHPSDVAQAVAASVMRRLARMEYRQIGTVEREIRDAIERELATALRNVDRWCEQCCSRGRHWRPEHPA